MDSRYAHAPGQTACTFSTKHQLLLTVGPDLILNAFSRDDFLEASPIEVRPHNHGTALCVACIDDIVISGGTDGQVMALKLPALQFDKIVMSFSLPVRCCAVSFQCRFVAAAGDECEVKVVDGLTNKLYSFRGHSGKIVGVAISDRAPVVASVAINGECRLWTIGNDDDHSMEPLAKFSGLKKILHPWSIMIAFSRDGLLLAVPDGREIILFDEGLRISKRLNTPHTKDIIGCYFTDDFLFSFGVDGQVIIYDCETKKVVGESRAAECAILSIAVSPDQKTLYAVDEEGSARIGPIKLDKSTTEASVNPEWSEEDCSKPKKPRRKPTQTIDSDSEFEVVSEPEQGDVDMLKPVTTDEPVLVNPSPPPSKQHPIIKLNNTPFDSNCRYLCWNAIGKIMARREPMSGQITIDVDFADSRAHRSVRFIDEYGIELASMSELGSVFASSHTAIYMPNGGWAMKVNTVLETTSEDETIISVACNEKFVYILTSQHLRIIDCSGIQLAILPTFKNSLCVCANRSGCIVLFSDNEHVKGMMITIDNKLHMTGPLTNQRISWVGSSLSDDFDLFGALDDKGRFYCLSPIDSNHYPMQWTVIHQSTLSPDATIWPVFFTSKSLHAIQLYNYSKYPDVLPVPLVSELSFSAPLLNNPFEPSYAKLNNELAINNLLLPSCKDAKLKIAADKNTLQLIQISIKMDHHQRALQLYSFLFQSKSRELAVQLAQHARATVLAEMMTNTKALTEPDDNDDDGVFVKETLVEPPTEQTNLRKSRLYIPVEEEFTFASQSQSQSQGQGQGQTQPHHGTQPLLPLSQERVNPFSKKSSSEATSLNTTENYVNVMARLSK